MPSRDPGPRFESGKPPGSAYAVLVGFDGSDGGTTRSSWPASRLGVRRRASWSLTVLYGGPLPMEYALLRGGGRGGRADLRAGAREARRAQSRHGPSAAARRPAILDHARGTRGVRRDRRRLAPPRRDRSKVLIGSVAGSLLNGAPCECSSRRRATRASGMTRPHDRRRLRRNAGSQRPCAAPKTIARHSNATLRSMTVVSPSVVVAVPGGASATALAAEPLGPAGGAQRSRGTRSTRSSARKGATRRLTRREDRRGLRDGVDLLVPAPVGTGR